jgi:hypothetical protein
MVLKNGESLTPNTAPVTNNSSVTTDQDTATSVTLSASDADGDTLTYSIVSGPSNGTLSGTAPNLTYTPNPSYTGIDISPSKPMIVLKTQT